jgi:hypothetical protein
VTPIEVGLPCIALSEDGGLCTSALPQFVQWGKQTSEYEQINNSSELPLSLQYATHPAASDKSASLSDYREDCRLNAMFSVSVLKGREEQINHLFMYQSRQRTSTFYQFV